MEYAPRPPEEFKSNIFSSGLRKAIELARVFGKRFGERLDKDIASAQEQPAADISQKPKSPK